MIKNTQLLAIICLVSFTLLGGCSKSEVPQATKASSGEKAAPKAKAPAQKITVNIPVEGMTCEGCEISISEAVGEIPGVTQVSANHVDGEVVVSGTNLDLDQVMTVIEKLGYKPKQPAS